MTMLVYADPGGASTRTESTLEFVTDSIVTTDCLNGEQRDTVPQWHRLLYWSRTE
jgi:hypothetical protein